ncbi:MAG: SBBP repeat-containing protein, partial [Candidatus Thorarchaeota archaeon]
LQWNRTYSDVNESGTFKSMIIDSQDNIYLLANVVQNIGGDIYNLYRLIKYNNLGEFQLKQDISNSWFIEFYSIAVDSSDNIYVAGKIQPSTEDIGDFYLKKVDNLGKEKWSYSWNVNTGDYCYVVDLNSVDDIFVAGITVGNLYVAKFEEKPPSEKKVSEIASYEPLILISILFATSIIIIISKTKKAMIKKQTK